MNQKLWIGIVITLLVIGSFVLFDFWGQTPVACTQIDEAALRSLDFSETDVRETLKWIEANHQFNKSDVHVSDFADGSVGLKWERDSSDYYARFYEDSLTQVFIRWGDLQPTGKEIIACFGSPDLYYATYGLDSHEYALAIDLWYLEKGIVVGATHFSRDKQTPVINENITMTDIRLLVPGSVEEMHRNIAPEGWAENPVDVLRPWPDKWEEIIVDSDN